MGLFRPAARIRRTGDGFAVEISDEERDLISDLGPQLRDLLVSTGGDPSGEASIRRLFPTAYPDDADRDAEYQDLMRDDLLRRRLEQVEVLSESAMSDRLTEAELHAWIGSINDLRLVLGTRLDISEEELFDDLGGHDESDEDRTHRAVYHYLGHLLGELIEAAGSG